MNLYVGTSGYSYKEWKGNFYPEKIPARDMLAFYATRLLAVEINNTFYRMPQPSLLENWRDQVPANFRFSVKASQRITHFKRLNNVEEETKYLLDTISCLGEKLGVVLFQLPPNMKKDLPRLETFLQSLPAGTRAAFEFRHPTWMEDDVLNVLRQASQALCISDTDDMPVTHIDRTTDWGYLRLRRVLYDDAALQEWLQRVRDQKWNDAFVFFKHEDEGTGPRLAAKFLELAAAR
ncbi:MAG: hypothetical protein QOD75_838 [Blastocatellia bacterium]|jgi:uncharacterized protein YecE (DUF72 family)|nr:hypothetical protein [Blastocatellia bacterium]